MEVVVEQKDLSVDIVHKEGSIQFRNFVALENFVKHSLEQYNGLALTDDNKGEIKKIMADLNAAKKTIDDERKRIKREYTKPLDLLELQVKQIIATIDETRNKLDLVVKEDDKKIVAELKAEFEGLFNEHLKINNIDFLKYEDMDQKINPGDVKSKRKKAIEIEEYFNKKLLDIEEIETDENRDRLFAKYVLIGDLQQARISLNRELQKEKELQNVEVEKIEKVEIKPEPQERVVEVVSEERIPKITFTIYDAPKSLLIEIKNLLERKGIKYE